MAGDSERLNDSGDSKSKLTLVERRRFLGVVGAGAMAGVAGCGGDGDDTPTPTDTPTLHEPTVTPTATDTPGEDATPTPTPTDTPTDAAGEETSTETGTPEPAKIPIPDSEGLGEAGTTKRFDVELYLNGTSPPPGPGEVQFNPYNSTSSWPFSEDRHMLLQRSHLDFKPYGDIVESWEYRPGVIDLQLRDNVFYTGGYPIDAENVLLSMELDDFVEGGEELDANTFIVEREQTGDYSFRLMLTDTVNEDFALDKALGANTKGYNPKAATKWLTKWVEKFRDASNYSEVEKLRRSLRNTQEDNPELFRNNPWKIEDADELGWNMRLRTRDYLDSIGLDHKEPAFVDLFNFTKGKYAIEGDFPQSRHDFAKGTYPFGGGNPGKDAPFDPLKINWVDPWAMWAVLMNASVPPMNSPSFRNAFAWVVNRDAWDQVGDVIAGWTNWGKKKLITPYFNNQMDQQWVSDDIRSNLTRYGRNTSNKKKGEEAMIRGGFVRDSDGRWLNNEGPRTGKPIELTIGHAGFMSFVSRNFKPIRKDFDEFGIKLETESSPDGLWGNANSGEFEMLGLFHGGWTPTLVLQKVFGDTGYYGGDGDAYGLPDAEVLPPVGDSQNWSDAEEFQTGALTDRLKVIQDQETKQEIIDTLTWAFNQAPVKIPVEFEQKATWENQEDFYVRNDPRFWFKNPGWMGQNYGMYGFRKDPSEVMDIESDSG